MGKETGGRDDQRSRLLDRLEGLLYAHRADRVLNPYRDCDPALDRPDAPAIRRQNLRRYLEAFGDARALLIGEAPGYGGCRFSGIPFTCEAQLVEPDALPWTHGLGLRQSSLGQPRRERSAVMVWEALDARHDCVLWNVFPWHPFGDSPLSNRKPTRRELEQAVEVLRLVLGLYGSAQVYAIGRTSERWLHELGVDAPYLRHPSHGGKKDFVAGVHALLDSPN